MSNDFPTVIVEFAFGIGASTGNYWHIGDAARGRIGTFAIGPDTLWSDVTDRVQNLSITAGTSSRLTSPLPEFEAGTATIVLDNSDRAFDPTNVNSPYYTPDQVVP